MNKAKPFLKWVGGKTALLPEIEKRFPLDYQKYIEPFLGGGAVYFSTFQEHQSILVDLNSELINTYKVVRDSVEELIVDLKQHVYDKDYYYQLRGVDRLPKYKGWSDIQRASRFIYLNKTCYNGLYRVNSRQEFNVPFGRYKNPSIVDSLTLRECSKALNRNTKIFCGSFHLVESIAERDDFVYLDPPYVPISPTSNFTNYTSEGFSFDMQLELQGLCQKLSDRGTKFMLSNSAHPSIMGLYKDFDIEVVEVPRPINSNHNKRGKVQEVLITNY